MVFAIQLTANVHVTTVTLGLIAKIKTCAVTIIAADTVTVVLITVLVIVIDVIVVPIAKLKIYVAMLSVVPTVHVILVAGLQKDEVQ